MLKVNNHNEDFNKCKGINSHIIQCFNSNYPNHTKEFDQTIKVPNNSKTKDDPNNNKANYSKTKGDTNHF